MPSRNIVKEYIPESYYHVYNRGVEKRDIFLDDDDYAVFLGLLRKYLTGKGVGVNRHVFDVFDKRVKLLSYCLMPNHFHLLLYQKDDQAISQLMRRITTGYVMYFNAKYDRVGGLFQASYKASRIDADDYLHHISRYIHLNPKDYKQWPYSSYLNYAGNKKTQWVDTGEILDLFENKDEYAKFVDEYVDLKHEIDILKYQLANDV